MMDDRRWGTGGGCACVTDEVFRDGIGGGTS